MEKQQINTHASRISAKLGQANEKVLYLVTLLSETTVRPTIGLWKVSEASDDSPHGRFDPHR